MASAIAAVLTAGAFAIFGWPYENYAAWWSWNRGKTAMGLTLYFAIGAGGGGFVGWAGAWTGGAHPINALWWQGIFYGVAGALALRAGFPTPAAIKRRQQAEKTTDITKRQIGNTISILNASLVWVNNMLEKASLYSAQSWLSSLSSDDLRNQSLLIFSLIKQQQMSRRAEQNAYSLFAGATEALNDADPQTQQSGRIQLMTYCARYFVEEHIKKMVNPGGAIEPAQ